MQYWQGKGKYSTELKELSDKLIPSMGEAPTDHGEFLRLYNRFAYDVYNNGLCNTDSLGDLFETLVERVQEIELTPKAAILIGSLDKLMKTIKENDDQSNYANYDCDCDIDEDEDNECYCDQRSDKEIHWDDEVAPLFEPVTDNNDGMSELGDCILEHVISVEEGL